MSKSNYTQGAYRHSGQGRGQHQEFMGPFNSVAQRIANHLPPNERVKPKPEPKKRHSPTSDEVILAAIRRHLINDIPVAKIALDLGRPTQSVRNWICGTTSRHLLQQVEEEIYEREKQRG